MAKELKFDEIGYWSELKLDIIREYAAAYSTILAAQTNPKLYHVYIDAFAGAGIHVSKTTGGFVPGSPLNALRVQPPFREHFLLDVNAHRVDSLQNQIGDRSDVHLYKGDCNEILLNTVLPQVQYRDFRRGLCILDPYGLDLDWKLMATAGQMKSIDIFLNFPVMDMNRNVLWRNPEGVGSEQVARMNRYWGDESWRGIAYRGEGNLFGFLEKQPNEVVVEAFRKRLLGVAGFKRVPGPLPMRNSNGAVVYYLFFASQKGTAENIVLDIFSKYRARGQN